MIDRPRDTEQSWRVESRRLDCLWYLRTYAPKAKSNPARLYTIFDHSNAKCANPIVGLSANGVGRSQSGRKERHSTLPIQIDAARLATSTRCSLKLVTQTLARIAHCANSRVTPMSTQLRPKSLCRGRAASAMRKSTVARTCRSAWSHMRHSQRTGTFPCPQPLHAR